MILAASLLRDRRDTKKTEKHCSTGNVLFHAQDWCERKSCSTECLGVCGGVMSTTDEKLALKRPDGWYAADNELIDVLASEIGIYALGVYHLLKRRAFLKDPDISLRGISKALTISTDSAAAAIATLKRAGLVEERPALGPNLPLRYIVAHAKDVLAARAAAGNPPRPEIRTRVKTMRVLNKGHHASENKDGGERNSGQQRPGIRTPNKEEDRRQRQEKTNNPLPPSQANGGCAHGSQDFDESAKPPWERSACAAVQRVKRECNWSDRRLDAVIEEALRAHCRKMGADNLTDSAELMVKGWREYLGNKHLMRFPVNERKFIQRGWWIDDRAWPWDEKRLEMGRRL